MYWERFLLLSSVAILAACGEDGSVTRDAALADAAPRQLVIESKQLLVGELVEATLTGGPGDVAVISVDAPTNKLDWNIHGHEDGATQTVYEELNRMTVDYVFVPSSQTDWWLLLRNSGPTNMDVMVQVELHGDMTWAWQ